jgi:large conductance mechanosensitive channel
MLQEFRAFIARGNVLDLAVAVIMGGAFGKVVTSMVNDVLMPPIGRIMGTVNFADLYIPLVGPETLKERGITSLMLAKQAGIPTINVGAFLNSTIDFLIVAWVVFMVVKAVNRFQARKAEEPAVAAEPSQSEKLLREIRDLLQERRA